ncbi:ribosomal lysine N-methyltransferase 3-like [Bidens hawaiensis]|uniref:ribosomal lysine N-methyltransferase 3-like n=1 Tax=Bidens hawaiensis TaxID=980011 RepID=UPI00404928CA
MTTTSSSRRLRAFKRWMNHHSINHSDALDLIIQPHQLCIKTLYDLHDGDVIATIPKRSCLTVKSSGACHLIEDFKCEGYMALAVAVMYERSLRQQSPWFGYLQLLPERNSDVPLLWSIGEIDELLVGTELHKTVKEDKALVYEDWKSCIVPFVESSPTPLDPDDFDLDHYLAAKSLISSRSFQIDNYYGFGMVPLADLFNHKTNAEDVHFTSVSDHSESDTDSSENIENQIDGNLPNGDCVFQNGKESKVNSPEGDFSAADDACDSNTEILEMIMVRDVKAGTEVFNTYGTMGNAALLHRYGFTEPDNPYNIVNIDLELVLQWSSSIFSSRHRRTRLSSWKKLHISEFPNQQIDYFEISSDGEPEVELLKLMFIILLSEKDYNEFERSNVVSICNKKGFVLEEITETNKKVLLTESVRSGLLSLADIRERCYGLRSLEDDVEALEACSVTNKKLYHSLVLRISERMIIKKLRAYASVGSARVRALGGGNESTLRKKLQKR